MKRRLVVTCSISERIKKAVEKNYTSLPFTEHPAGILEILDGFWNQAKPFLKKGYRLENLSNEINVPVQQLALFFNKVKGKNFSDFLNQARIQYCLDFLRRSAIKKVNLRELSSLCGFSNRNTFTVYFKRITGTTPSGYIRTLK